MKIAVLANFNAGGANYRAVMKHLKEAWAGCRLLGVRGYGGELLSAMPLKAPDAGLSYVPRLWAALDELLAEAPDFVLTVGGDGTAAYAAEHLLRTESRIPLAGLGTGTANVGPIVTLSPVSLPQPEELEPESLGAVEAADGAGRHIAYGFNDVVLGNTFLGTKDGKTVTFDAALLASEGKLAEAVPVKRLFTGEADFTLNGAPLPGADPAPAQMIVSPVEKDRFYGRAVTGLLCYTPDSPYRAAVWLSPEPVVTAEDSPSGFTAWRPGYQLLLQEGDVLAARGLAEGVCAVADGNPYRLPEGCAKFYYRPSLLTVLTDRKTDIPEASRL